MNKKMSKIKKFLKKRKYWYHKIELAPGIITPGTNIDPIWSQIRKVRKKLNYKNRSVLDIATFDGMFAFEAEELGAKNVIATDCQYKTFSNFLFCKEIFESNVKPYFNVSAYNLVERLDSYFHENYDTKKSSENKFDIVQHFGLLYHLKDPLLSLAQCRSVIKDGGYLFIETEFVINSDDSFLLFNGQPKTQRIRNNYSVWWAPTKKCLFEMLSASMFDVVEKSFSYINFSTPIITKQSMVKSSMEKNFKIGRCAVLAKARPITKVDKAIHKEIVRSYRTPGYNKI